MLHSTAFQRLGIPGVLLPWEVRPEGLADFVRGARVMGVRGFCVTLPHKEAILPLVDEVSDRVRRVGAANLVTRRDDRLWAENTDIPGFMAPLAGEQPTGGGRALVLGAGGAARSAVAGLAELGWREIWVASRSEAKAKRLAADFSLRSVAWEARHGVEADMLVNTTPLGMAGTHEGETPYQREWLAARPGGVAYDLVYTPLTTRFLREAASSGWRCIGGLDMFMAQADRQFAVWTGQPLPPEAREWVLAALAGRRATPSSAEPPHSCPAEPGNETTNTSAPPP